MKRKRQQKRNEVEEDSSGSFSSTDSDEEPAAKLPSGKRKKEWTNRTRVLVFSSRGVSSLGRHLMNDLKTFLPHSKTDTKLDCKHNFGVINEIAEMKNANKVVFFEARKKMDLYLWLANVPSAGPTAKFLVRNIHTMLELNLTGNCLRSSRPVLSFGPEFDDAAHWAVLKELFIQIFGVPNHHPRSQPFIDRVMCFAICDNRVWVRNYQVVAESGALAEVGPEFTLEPIKIFAGSFGGPTLYENPNFVHPNEVRAPPFFIACENSLFLLKVNLSTGSVSNSNMYEGVELLLLVCEFCK